MKYLLPIVAVFAIAAFVACEPRVDFDEGQWGDHAYINEVYFFTVDEEEHQLNDYYTEELTTTGIRRRILDTSTAVDSLAATATVTIPSGVDMTQVGIIFAHRAKKIEPLEGAPRAGIVGDFRTGPFRYRLISADGTVRDWDVIVTE